MSVATSGLAQGTRRASAAKIEPAEDSQQDFQQEFGDRRGIQLLPANQLPRRHSTATPYVTQGSEVPHINPVRVESQRIPPAVPVRNRKPSNTDKESTTHKSMAINSAPHGTLAQFPHVQTNPFLPETKYAPLNTDTLLFVKSNPFEDRAVSGSCRGGAPPADLVPAPREFHQSKTSPEVKPPPPPAIPPPPARPRRSSAAFQAHDGYLDPRNSALNQRRSSSPFQNYSGTVENDLSGTRFQPPRNNSFVNSPPYGTHSQINPQHSSQKQLNARNTGMQAAEVEDRADPKDPGPVENSPAQMPTIIVPKNCHELQKNPPTKENSQMNKITQFRITHNTFASDAPNGGRPPNSQKPFLNHSATESSESGIGSEKNCTNGCKSPPDGKVSVRQDSNVSSDSMSQTSSPSYTTKTMETPLLLHHIRKMGNKQNLADMMNAAEQSAANNAALTKSMSTPAGLQTCVKFTGSSMTLQHRIIRDIRRPSTNYFTRGRLKFRFIQIIINAFALVALAGGLAVYLRSSTTMVRYINKTVTTTIAVIPPETNPAPGFCFQIVVEFCANHQVPYNFTTFPNHVVNMNQQQAEQVVVDFCAYHRVPYNYTRFPSRQHVNQAGAAQELELYDALVDVRCYELSSLFLCSVMVPKCGTQGELLYPCKSLCEEMKHRCGFFLEVFGLPALPDYLLQCTLLPDSEDPDACVGHREVREAKIRAQKPSCSRDGFLCDYSRCIPLDWKCDGHLDCEDQSDEQDCNICPAGMVHCGENKCMNVTHKCDGIVHCPFGQDERNCIRLQEKMGDVGRGLLQVLNPQTDQWLPACVSNWDSQSSAQAICSLMGYTYVNSTRLSIKDTNVEVPPPQTTNLTDHKARVNWVKDFRSCGTHHYPIVNLECTHYDCGKRRTFSPPTKRIVGGSQSQPGDWPFLAALLGGPEEIFYCAGVLISDQWVLTASHCVGNFSQSNIDGWRIQLGITRRHSHNYYGQKVKVKRVIRHPLYRVGGNHDNDVALFQLKNPVNFNEHLLPVCLPPPGTELVPGTNCTVIGWGKSEDLDSSEYEPAVNEVEVPVIPREVCNDWMIYRDYNVTDGMICAGFAEGGKDACQGDSGGPLLCPLDGRKERWFVGGIVSWGIKCAHPQLPGVYAYVPKYLPWIKEEMKKHSD